MVTTYSEILKRVEAFDPNPYGATRNYKNGQVSRLSPYISRGVISTKTVYNSLKARFDDLRPFEKFVQELAWRDFWQRIWQENNIDEDLKRPQSDLNCFDMPEAIVKARTGIQAVDQAIEELYDTGYMHNHMRMYVATIVCNISKCYWKEGARWMYANLKDADWGSNALSWQWVAGTNSSKKYYANQENINKYFESDQKGTFLDHTYERLTDMPVPEVLRPETRLDVTTQLPDQRATLDAQKPTLVYTHYNLDPEWHKDLDANRVLLLEPNHFEAYPLSNSVLDFILELGKNIAGLQIHAGSFSSLKALTSSEIIYKEHPFSKHFEGTEESRDWLSKEVSSEKSFFRYWKNLKKQLPEFD